MMASAQEECTLLCALTFKNENRVGSGVGVG